MKLLNDFAIALVKPSRYRELLPNSVGRTALFVTVLILISSVTLITGSIMLYRILGQYYAENVPEFEFKDQTLMCEDTFDLEFAGVKLMMDTSRQLTEEELENAVQGALFDSDSMIIKTGGRVVEAEYSEMTGADTAFTKDSLYTYKDIVKISITVAVIVSIIFSAAGFLLGALITAALASFLTFRLPRKNAGLSFGQLYKLAVYSRGLPVILSLVLSMFIGGIPFIISIALSLIILNTALFKMSLK